MRLSGSFYETVKAPVILVYNDIAVMKLRITGRKK